MRSLESIFGDEREYKRTILFEEGRWCIYRRKNDRCYIVHRCANVNMAEIPTNSSCTTCGDVMPIPLKGLFILNEWER